MLLCRILIIINFMMFCLTACTHRENTAIAAPVPQADQYSLPTSVALTMMGYNYTDRDIRDFYVDGTNGGDISVSSTVGGGGGSVCCVSYGPNVSPFNIEVRWQADACRYNLHYASDGTQFFDIRKIYKRRTVNLARQGSGIPKYLEIHIFPDEHVEAAVTAEPSPPRLVLDSRRRITAPFRNCPDDQQPD